MRPTHPRPHGRNISRLLLATLIPLASATAQQVRTGTVAQTYAELCASCHGKNLEGAQAPSMLDDVWIHGGDDESLALSIRNGFPLKEMPAWSAALPEKEIRAMVIYIREQRAKYAREQTVFAKPAESVTVKSLLHRYRLDTWVGELKEPYSLAFLPTGRAVMTEKLGRLFVIENGKIAEQPVSGLPEVDTGGQAGLFDVVPHPDYAKNGWLYLAYSDLQKDADGKAVSLTRIMRGKLRDGALVEQQTIFQAKPEHYVKAGGVHFGGRIAFDRAGYLFFTIGERGGKMVAQDLGLPIGKIHRLHDDGRIPADNPFAHDAKTVPSIWSYGHRNPQGLAISRETDQVFDAEHGPRGGDELNLVEKGRNYGWPVITYGMEYNGTAMTELTAKEGMEQPVTYWTPSPALCGISFYTGDLFPKWKNHLFVASLAAQELRRVELKDGKLVTQEILFKDLGRIRHVIGGPDGALYVLLPTRIARIAPAE
ncbi:MAG: PQQ-dependent sugar dehydrogenase [Verrucomicrobia bacterium]|nr:PQQ-dependent sugar dehydrogenase [Verrucomicrobiota bacterium]